MIHQYVAFFSQWNLPKYLLVVALGLWPLVVLAQPAPLAVSVVTPRSEVRPNPAPDSRYKADILVIIAHPDDETLITGYLAKAIYDDHKRVAVLLGTRGNSGDNEVGYEQAAALADVREIEVRRGLASMDIVNIWFMSGSDTPGENPLRSLETWGHGKTLDEAVRIVRLTRPEVIITWLPHFVVGENHGDHQASAVIATEAFDMAGDPTEFPEQVSFPRDTTGYSNLTEGLRPWQPKKLYFFSDATQMEFMEGQGPTYSLTAISPSLHAPYARSAALETTYYLTPGDTGEPAQHALQTGDFKDFEAPVQFVFGKSLVGSSVTGDIFDGVVPGPIPFAPVRGFRPQIRKGLSIELGDSWAFYREFWPAHDIERLAGLMKVPEIGVEPGGTLEIPLLLHNDTSEPEKISLQVELPSGWTQKGGAFLYPVEPHDVYPVRLVLTPPAKSEEGWQQITWRAESNGQTFDSVTVKTMLTIMPSCQGAVCGSSAKK
jgi:LmbE family N-acetylglucosaminyl deacetylase